jgi:GrpB-like predicted nucleotidyltransferase (UPF0157 family)
VTRDRDVDTRRAAAARDLADSGELNARIELVEYDVAWPARFNAEATRLARILPTLRWHHIGSTAVSGVPAKPIIDMMALTDNLDRPLPALINEAGYAYPATYNSALTERRWLCRPSAAHRTHHLHLVADREELERHLRFRDARCAPTPDWPPSTRRSSAAWPTRCPTTARATPPPRRPSSPTSKRATTTGPDPACAPTALEALHSPRARQARPLSPYGPGG